MSPQNILESSRLYRDSHRKLDRPRRTALRARPGSAPPPRAPSAAAAPRPSGITRLGNGKDGPRPRQAFNVQVLMWSSVQRASVQVPTVQDRARVCPMVERRAPCRPGSRRRRRSSPRVRPHCRFRNRGTDYISESGIKWMGGSTKRQCARALPGGRWSPR